MGERSEGPASEDALRTASVAIDGVTVGGDGRSETSSLEDDGEGPAGGGASWGADEGFDVDFGAGREERRF